MEKSQELLRVTDFFLYISTKELNYRINPVRSPLGGLSNKKEQFIKLTSPLILHIDTDVLRYIDADVLRFIDTDVLCYIDTDVSAS